MPCHEHQFLMGQSLDWCSEEMPCHEDQTKDCPIKNWCVCQWAFASYLEMAGGCEHAVDLECSATNMAAVKAYEAASEPSYKAALECIKSKCPGMVSAPQ